MASKATGRIPGSILVIVGFACVPLYVVFGWAMSYGIENEYVEYRLRTSGVATNAVVIGISKSGARIPGADIDYEFTYGGRKYKGSDMVSITFQRDHPVGSTIRILFLARSPEINRPSALNLYMRGPTWLFISCGAAFMISVPIGLFQFWLRQRRQTLAKQM